MREHVFRMQARDGQKAGASLLILLITSLDNASVLIKPGLV
jgi:hypothetical protein